MLYYCRSSLLSVAICCLIFPLKNSGFKVSAAVFYYRRSEFTTDSKFTIRSVFSTGSEGTITRVSRNPTFAQKKKGGPSLGVFCLISCVSGQKGPPKNLRQTLVSSDKRVSLVKVLPNGRVLWALGESHRPLTLIFLKSIAIHLPFLSRYFCKSLVAPYRAILRNYRCDTPYRAILFRGG